MKHQNSTIQTLFDQYPHVDIILTGVYDTRTKTSRFWEFKPTHLNIFYPQAIFVRNQPKLWIESLEVLLQLMTKKQTLLYNFPLVKITSLEPKPICKDVIEEYFESIEVQRRMYQRYFEDLNVIEYFPPRTILIVGQTEEIGPIGRCFEHFGWRCYYYWTEANVQFKKDLMELDEIIEMPNHILIVHNYDAIDVSNVPAHIPIHFWAKQGVHPNLPLNWEGHGIFFHAYLGSVEQYKKCHPYAMSHVKQTMLVPHGWEPETFPDLNMKFEDRPIEFGFMGSLDDLPHPYDIERRDYLSVHIRDLRTKYVRFAEQELGLTVVPKGTHTEYVQFLNTTKYILNVSGIFGFLTERQFHAMGCGGILVQNYFKYLDHLGYKHRVNCLLFTDKTDLKVQMDWIQSHPHDAKNIQIRGKQLAQSHTLIHRIEVMRKAMLQYEEEDHVSEAHR